MWCEKLKNGKYRYAERFLNPMTGKYKKLSVTMEKNNRQAEKMAAEALREKMHVYMTPEPKSIRLSELIDLYLKEQGRTVKQSTLIRNDISLHSTARILGPDVLVNKLTAGYVRQQLLSADEEPGTMNERLTRFKAMVRWGYRNDYVGDIHFLDKLEPFADVPRRQKIEDKFLEASELEQLLSGMQVRQWRDLTAFLSLSGLRFGEAAALQCSDVSLKDRVIRVTKTYDGINNVTTSPKTFTSTRDVYMQDELYELCRRLLADRFVDVNIVRIDTGSLLFAKPDGTHIGYTSYNHYLADHAEKTIGRKITPHVLRHTHASLLMENGMDIDAISDRLGHSDSKITKEIYLHVTQKLRDKRNEQMRRIRLLAP